MTFRYRVNGEASDRKGQGLLTLPLAEFIRRYLVHVPEPGTKVVRCYGLYAPTKHAALAVCRAQLGQGPVVQPPVLDWQTACQPRGRPSRTLSGVWSSARLPRRDPARQDSPSGRRSMGGRGMNRRPCVAPAVRGGVCLTPRKVVRGPRRPAYHREEPTGSRHAPRSPSASASPERCFRG